MIDCDLHLFIRNITQTGAIMNALEDDNHAARIHAALTCQHILEYHHIGYFEKYLGVPPNYGFLSSALTNISEYRKILACCNRR